MRCRAARRRLTPYLDERLGERERQGLEVHLLACERCRATLALNQTTRAVLGAQGPAEPPPGLAARAANLALAAARGRARTLEPAADWMRLLRWPALATAAAAAALALALFVESPGPDGGSSPEPRDAAATLAQLSGLDEAVLDPLEEGARVLGQEVE